MSLRGLLRRGVASSSTHSLNALAEPQNLEDAMRAANFILDDDLQSAEDGLHDGNSSFHKLGHGLVSFMKASLGFEPEVMREASERLAEAESSASNDYRRAQRESSAFHSEIYGAGSEYALCSAEAQLLSCIVAVLSESLSESLKGFYKLRKAYMTLESIVQAEDRYMEQLRSRNPESRTNTTNLRDLDGSNDVRVPDAKGKDSKPTEITSSQSQSLKRADDWDSDNDDDFEEAQETIEGSITPREYVGQVEIDGMVKRADSLSLSLPSSPQRSKADPKLLLDVAPIIPKLGRTLTYDPDSEVFAHSIDIFIHSGTSVFFGMIQLLLSIIPPAFARLLSIIGFQGDRDRGLRLLWQATKFRNVNGALAGLVLLSYYNSFIGFNDIVPDDELTSDLSTGESIKSHPIRRLEKLLTEMRSRYPRSGLWLLEAARMQSSKRNLDSGLTLLQDSLNTKRDRPQLKQVHALTQFEFSLQTMYAHHYEDCTTGFEECCRLNNWSHALYYFIAASAQIQLYRKAKAKEDEAAASGHETRMKELLQLSRSQIGKRKILARPMPFDAFVGRKMSKWEARSAAQNVPLVEAIGVSPLVEIIYFWNGFKKMAPKHVERTMTALDESEEILREPKWAEEHDEHVSLAVLRATTLRTAGKLEEAMELLEEKVHSVDRALMRGGHRDNWQHAVACYEMASCLWAWKNEDGVEEEELKRRVREAQEWLEKASRSESYELEARMGMRITTGLNTVKAWLERYAA